MFLMCFKKLAYSIRAISEICGSLCIFDPCKKEKS